MTTVRGMTDGFPGGQRRSYISTAPFNSVFYTYANNTLTPLPNMYSGYCPAGRILRENGKKLFPDTNPGVTQYYVGVYDAISFFNGFIDPNDAHFSVYNTDKPVYVPDNYDFGNSTPDLGPSVYTQGNIIAELAPDGSNYMGMINSTQSAFTAYSELYFNDANSPAFEAGNGLYSNYVGSYIGSNYAVIQASSYEYDSFTGMGIGLNGNPSLSTPTILAQGDFPYIVAEGAVANIVSAGEYSANSLTTSSNSSNNIYTSTNYTTVVTYGARNATVVLSTLNANITETFINSGTTPILSLNGTSSDIYVVGAQNATLLLSTPASLITANFTNGISTPQLLINNSEYYNQMGFSGSANPFIESGGFIHPANYAGIDGNRGDLYATGMLNLENAVGAVQLSGGSATLGSNTIFTYGPYIFLTYQTVNNGTPGTLSYSVNTGAGTLTINSGQGSDSNYVNWLAVYNDF